MQYHFIKEQVSHYSVCELCECFGFSRSGYYDWLARGLSKRRKEDAVYKEAIGDVHKRAKGRYGYRPIYHHLQETGHNCGRDRVRRLMNDMGIKGLQKKRFKPLVTDSNHGFGYSPNLLRELGKPERCDQVWVADTTYLRTHCGWTYLATVMDLYSRRIVGWSVSSSNNGALVCEALRSAAMTRNGQLTGGLIHHSDRGSTYASYEYAQLLDRLGMTQSMSAKGNCYDNAAQESFYGRYKSSSVRNEIFADEAAVRSHVFDYIEIFYNRYRKHSSLGYKSPVEFEGKIAPPMGGQGGCIPTCIHNN